MESWNHIPNKKHLWILYSWNKSYEHKRSKRKIWRSKQYLDFWCPIRLMRVSSKRQWDVTEGFKKNRNICWDLGFRRIILVAVWGMNPDWGTSVSHATECNQNKFRNLKKKKRVKKKIMTSSNQKKKKSTKTVPHKPYK